MPERPPHLTIAEQIGTLIPLDALEIDIPVFDRSSLIENAFAGKNEQELRDEIKRLLDQSIRNAHQYSLEKNPKKKAKIVVALHRAEYIAGIAEQVLQQRLKQRVQVEE